MPLAALSILESAPDAVVVVDRTGRILLVNGETERLFGYDRSELLGHAVEMLMPEKHRPDHVNARARYDAEPSRRSMHARQAEFFGRRKDGTVFPVEIGLNPLETDGQVATIASVRDISPRKQAEHDQLRLAQAQEAVRMRDEFLSAASHELRTPLTALQLQLESLQIGLDRTDLARDQLRAKLRKAVRHLQRVNELVDRLLDVSRMVTSPLALQPEVMDMVTLAHDVIEDFRDQAARVGSTISMAAPDSALGTWDRFRIEQIIVNLVSNAVKYGAGRPIAVEIETDDRMVTVRVHDQGIGILPAETERIFDRFARGSRTTQYGGLGLGLYIARQLTESHGGRLRALSQRCDGATFELELPRIWPTRHAK